MANGCSRSPFYTERQSAVNDACHHKPDRLDDVVEFFRLDVRPSKYAS